MRIALAANPASGGGVDREAVAAALRAAGADVVTGGYDAEELERLAAARPERLAVAGGDGSIALVAALAARLDVPLAVIPAGTANDFARANGLPDDLGDAARLAVEGRGLRRLDLGRLADGAPFVNAASTGLAVIAADRAQPLKRRLGALAYAAGALRAAVAGRPAKTTVRVDGAIAFEGRSWQAIVAITGAFGGGSGIDEAHPGDGLLDVVVVPAGSRLALARRAWGMRTGTIARQADVAHARGRVVELALPHGTGVNADGELRAGGLERVTVEPAAFALVAAQ